MADVTTMTYEQIVEESEALIGTNSSRADELAEERMKRVDEFMDLSPSQGTQRVGADPTLRADGTQLMRKLEQSPAVAAAEQALYHKTQLPKYKSGKYDDDIALAVKTYNECISEECSIDIHLPVSKKTLSITQSVSYPGEVDVIWHMSSATTISFRCKNEEGLRGFLERRLT